MLFHDCSLHCSLDRDDLLYVYGSIIRKTFNDAFLVINVCDMRAYSKA